MAILIRLDQLRDQPRSDQDTLPIEFAPERLGHDYFVKTPFAVRWKAQMVQGVVEVRAHVEGAFGFGCSRCGDPLTLPIQIDVHHHWLPAGELVDEDDEEHLADDDPDVGEHDGVAVDLEPMLIDAIVVEVPLAPGCADATEGQCERWSDEPIVYHAGGQPPEEVETQRPFADLLAKVRKGPEIAEG
jgi:uncharacterized metal-binding protein YceD (DUF177 family)